MICKTLPQKKIAKWLKLEKQLQSKGSSFEKHLTQITNSDNHASIIKENVKGMKLLEIEWSALKIDSDLKHNNTKVRDYFKKKI